MQNNNLSKTFLDGFLRYVPHGYGALLSLLFCFFLLTPTNEVQAWKFDVVATSTQSYTSSAIDTTNQVLYIGMYNNIYRCVLSTGCDQNSEFTQAYGHGGADTYGIAIDQANGVLFFATAGTISRCLLSTSCDASGDFTTAYVTPSAYVNDLVIDTTNNVLYASGYNAGNLYRCVLSTGCDASGDFTTAYTSAEWLFALAVDQTNGTLYVGTYSSGLILRCALSSNCDASGDFSTAYDAADQYIYDFAIDTVNGVLYASGYTSENLYRCALSTGCDASGDFTSMALTTGEQQFTLEVDQLNGILYVGSYPSAQILRCSTSSGCTASTSFSVATNTITAATNEEIGELIVDQTTGNLYAGASDGGGNGYIFRYVPIVVSGSLYSDEGSTLITAPKPLKLAVLTSSATLYSASTTGSGTWSVVIDTPATSSRMVAWIDATSSVRASLFTKSSSTVNNITGLSLYKDHAIIRHEGTSGTSTTNTDLAFYDYTNDTDIMYDASSTLLTVYEDQELYIQSGKTFDPGSAVNVSHVENLGTFTAPTTTLTIGGNFVNSGTFTHNGGTINFTGMGTYATGTFIGTSALNDVSIRGGGVDAVTTAYDTSETYIFQIAIDSTNGVLYAGGGGTGNGPIYRCLLSTGCDSSSDFTTAYNTGETHIFSIAIDTASGTLYAGSYPSGKIFRCALSTGCDASGDFTTAYDTVGTDIRSLAIDSINGVLYAGSGTDGIIYRCALSTNCDASGDFTTAYDTAETYILSLTIDSINGVLYAGSGGTGIIYRCALSTGCDASGDFTTAYDSIETNIWNFTIDTTNNALYVGTYPNGIIYRCSLSTNCDASGDFTTAFDTTEDEIRALFIDTITQSLYVGTYPNGIIYRCALSTACDSSIDFSNATNTGESGIITIIGDPTNNTLYAGGAGSGIIYRRSNDFTFGANASTSALTITSKKKVIGPNQLTIGGNYVNAGTFVHSTGTVIMSSSTAHTIFGDTSSTSPFYNLTIGGIGQTSFLSQVQTATDTSESAISVSVIDTTNGVLYAGSTGGGMIFRCVLSTGCDSSTDFTIPYDSASPNVYALTIDTVNAILYIATGNTGIIYRCALSTNCDASGDFTTAYDTTETDILSLVIASSTLYVGTSANGLIYRCLVSTNCDAAGDFTTAYDTTESAISALTVDVASGVLYAGSGSGGIIYRCALSTGCDASGDFTTATNTPETNIQTMIIDSTNGVLYVGTYSSGIVYRCALSTGCDSTGDFTTAYDSAATGIYAFALDQTNPMLYLGLSNGDIYRCSLFSDCDSSSDFILASDTPASYVATLSIDSTSGVLYGGTGNSGIIYRCLCGTPATSTTAMNVTINSGASFTNNEEMIVQGNYTNNGTSTGNTTTTTPKFLFTSESAQTLSGNLVGSSSLPYTTFRGGGTKTFSSNASTTNDFTIDSGSTVVAPNLLTIGGNYTNNGTFAHNSGTTTFSGTNTYATGTLTGTSAFKNLVFAGNGTTTIGAQASTSNFFIQERQATPITSIGTIGERNTGGGGTSITITTTAAAESGNLVILNTATDNHSTSDGDFNEITSVTDSVGGNTWVKLKEYTNGQGAAYAGITVSVWYSIITNTIPLGGTVTVNFATDTTQKAVGSWEFDIGDGARVIVASSTTLSVDASTNDSPGLMSISNLPNHEYLFIRGIAEEYNKSFTATTSGFTKFSEVWAGSAESAADSLGEFRIYTGTGLSSSPTTSSSGGSPDYASIFLALKIVYAPIVVAPKLLTVSGSYVNNGTFIHNSGTTTLNGTSAQTFSGSLVGADAFNNISITNTSGAGSSSQSIIFNDALETDGRFTMTGSTSVAFPAGATSTLQDIHLEGATGQYAWLRSNIPGTRWGLAVPGTQDLVTYLNVQDSSACPTTITSVAGTSIDSGNNVCWEFPVLYADLSSASNQEFTVGQATTSMSTITVTDGNSITAVNDIRIVIATTSVGMLWDTTDATATFGGTASGKVANPVTYEGNGSILVIPVTTDFAFGDTLTIGGLSYGQFATATPAINALSIRTGGSATTTSNNTDDKTIAMKGSFSVAEHGAGQIIENGFSDTSTSNSELYSFGITASYEDVSISSIVLTLSDISTVHSGDLSTVRIYRDWNSNNVYDAGDIAVGGSGVVSISGANGSITFNTPFTASSTHNYLLVADISNLYGGDSMTATLSGTSIIGTGVTSGLAEIGSGTLTSSSHRKTGPSYGGGYQESGGGVVAGNGSQTGGGQDGGGSLAGGDTGESIGSEPGFNAPTTNGTPYSTWTAGANAYTSDGVYTTTTGTGSHSYGTFGFSVPSNNTITGIEVKLEASASTAAGTISVRLSWDGGSSVTSLKTTNTLTSSDVVYVLGSPSDTWGRAWSANDFTNGNFTIEVVGNPSSNTVKIDAVQVRVYHQTSTQGGQGGGGAEVSIPSSHFFANAYSALGDAWSAIMRRFLFWIIGQ